MSNMKTFMASTIIHNLQEFYIHYGMYVVTRRLRTLFLFFFFILQDFLIQNGDYERLFKGDISVIFLSIFFIIVGKRKKL
jgi:hypothetical protein